MAKRRQSQNARRDPISRDPYDGEQDAADDIARLTWERWKQSDMHLRDALKEAKENYNFLAGQQWEEDDMASLREKQRPVIVFNRTQATVSAVSGYEINSRQDIAYLPREPDESGMAEVDTEAAKYFRQECDAEDEESEQFRDMLATGYGWIEHRMDYEEDADGMMKVERVDMFEMRYDPHALRPNLTDRTWDIRGKFWDKDKAKDKWPNHNFDLPQTSINNAADDLDGQPQIDRLAASFYHDTGLGDFINVNKNQVLILEHTWFEMEPYYTAMNPTTGRQEDLELEQYAKLKERLGERGIPMPKAVKRERRRFKRAFVHGRHTLTPKADLDAPCEENFHYQCITGYRHRNKRIWFGVVSLMKDPQRWANKWLSQYLHQLNTNTSTGLWYEKGAFERVQEVEDKIAKPGFVQAVEPGYLDKFRKEEPNQLPQDAFELMQYAISSIRDSTGANLEILGQQTNDQSGVLEAHRKQSAMNVLAPLFAAKRQYLKIAGRITLWYIRHYLSDGRWIRLVGQANAKYVQLARKDESAKYDIVVDSSPSSPNQKEMVFGTIAMILPQLEKMGIPIPSSIVKYVPGLPAQLAEEWQQMIAQKQSQPQQDPKTQLAQGKLQLEQQKMQVEAQSSANQDRLDQERLNFDKMKLMFERWMEEREDARTQAKLDLERDKLRSKEKTDLAGMGHEIIVQHRDHAHERQLTAAEQAFNRAEASADREHASQEGDEDRKVARETKPKERPNASR